ncbi:MAG: hypothetical protein JETT_3027 [Candidatus Jettenia ecosi]|uniref:Uncharacterized protein n=1 Tax=Candidatus Jettenia ecosi TaxID=2494326 RepID=A0A533Q7W9_9BACT|nr:MAG: hypothetical protein JETT_3027 [Candidatus Jettenia ecosi]
MKNCICPSGSILPKASCSQTLFGNTVASKLCFEFHRETEFPVHACSQTMSSWKWGRVWEQDGKMEQQVLNSYGMV